MSELHVGLAVLGVPLLLIGAIFLRRYRLLALIYLLAVVIGLGYLTTTGAVKDIGAQALTYINGTTPDAEPAATEESTPAPAETPAPTTPEPAPTTTPEPTTPAPTTTPEPTTPAPTTPEPAPTTPPSTTPPSTTTPEPTTPPTPPSDSTTTPAPSPAP